MMTASISLPHSLIHINHDGTDFHVKRLILSDISLMREVLMVVCQYVKCGLSALFIWYVDCWLVILALGVCC